MAAPHDSLMTDKYKRLKCINDQLTIIAARCACLVSRDSPRIYRVVSGNCAYFIINSYREILL